MPAAEHPDAWRRIAGSTQVLLRSRIEIAAILQSLIDRRLPLVSHHQVHDHLFIARLHRVCAEQDYIVVGYSDNKIANAEVFAAGTILLGASHPRGHVSFMVGHPVELDDPVRAIRFDFPQTLLIEQRRVSRRISVAAGATLNCLADGGGITPFAASVVDVSLSGMGVMVYDPAITLTPGTLLAGCRIDLPDGGVTAVDMQVIHASRVVLADGTVVCRAGCRLIGDADRIDRLLKVFVTDLERRDGDSGAAGP